MRPQKKLQEPGRSPLWKDHQKMTVSFTRQQFEALKAEALRRAPATGGRPDASALVREAVDAWLPKNSGKR